MQTFKLFLREAPRTTRARGANPLPHLPQVWPSSICAPVTLIFPHEIFSQIENPEYYTVQYLFLQYLPNRVFVVTFSTYAQPQVHILSSNNWDKTEHKKDNIYSSKKRHVQKWTLIGDFLSNTFSLIVVSELYNNYCRRPRALGSQKVH